MGGTGKAEAAKLPAAGNGSTGCGKSQFKPAFGSTGFLACAGFAALIIDAQPRVAVLLDFFRSLFSRDILARLSSGVLTPEGLKPFVKQPASRRRLALILSAFVGIASAMLPLRVDAQKSERAKVIGAKLMCMCGCGQILTACNHINCPSSAPMSKEVDQHVAAGVAAEPGGHALSVSC